MDEFITEKESATVVIGTSKGFKAGLKRYAIVFSMPVGSSDIPFILGYLLWGGDIWIGKIPMIKLMILINIVNIILMWTLKP